MHLLCPKSPPHSKQPDEPFAAEVVFADTHASYEKRKPKELDWWAFHSRRGREDNNPTGLPCSGDRTFFDPFFKKLERGTT